MTVKRYSKTPTAVNPEVDARWEQQQSPTLDGRPLPYCGPVVEPYINIQEVVRRMADICPRTVDDWIKSKGFPCFCPSKRTRLFRWSLIERWLESQRAN